MVEGKEGFEAEAETSLFDDAGGGPIMRGVCFCDVTEYHHWEAISADATGEGISASNDGNPGRD